MHRFGFWSAVGALVASLAYGVPQLLQVAGLLPTPLDRILIFAPSLILAPFFVATVASSYEGSAAHARLWRLSALCLALLYGAMASMVYITQISAVIPSELAGQSQAAGFACCGLHMPLTGIDLLGYTYMSLALLLLAPTYRRSALRWTLIINGLLAPLIFLQFLWPALIYPAAAWLVTFPLAMALMAREFRDAKA